MKNILLLLFLLITLSSCEKDNDGVFYNSDLVKSIEIQGQGGQKGEKMIIKYDDLDRVYSINDTIFYYDSNDKVSHSRYVENETNAGFEVQTIVKKSYTWDAQNRLKSIQVDSAYQKMINPEGVMFINSASPYVEAYFYYSGVQTLPDSIAFSDGDKDTYITFKKLYHVNGNISKIEDIQLEEGVLSSLRNTVFYKSTYLDYSEQDNYLYPLYNKLGFLPKGLGYVASRKMIITSEIVETIGLNGIGSALDSKSVTLKKIYSSNKSTNGYPTVISVNSMIDFDNGQGYTNAGSSDTYISY